MRSISSGHAGATLSAPLANWLSDWRPIRFSMWLVVFSLLLAVPGKRSKAQTVAEDYRVKAAFIFHFAQLVDWPPEKTAAGDSLVLCTLGEDPFHGALEGMVGGKVVGNRILRIRHLEEPQDMQACQIVFLGRAQSKRIPMLVATLHHAPVLTVGETAGFLDAGGMIDFLLEGKKLRFEVNLDAAESADLKIGSRLLVLAQRVVAESHGK
jgi:hypothetical protein